MNYVIIPTKDEKRATHKNVSNDLFMISEVEDNVKVSSKTAIVTKDISEYTPLQAYVAKLAAELEQAKKEAVNVAKGKLYKELEKGVTVDGGIVLGAKDSDMTAFTQGLVLINAAESLVGLSSMSDAPSGQVTDETMVSSVFGRGVVDTKGDNHDMSIKNFKKMVVSYGQAIGALEGATLAKIAQINAVENKKDLETLMNPPKEVTQTPTPSPTPTP